MTTTPAPIPTTATDLREGDEILAPAGVRAVVTGWRRPPGEFGPDGEVILNYEIDEPGYEGIEGVAIVQATTEVKVFRA